MHEVVHIDTTMDKPPSDLGVSRTNHEADDVDGNTSTVRKDQSKNSDLGAGARAEVYDED